MDENILEKLLPVVGDLTCDIFNELSDQELNYVAELHGIGSGRDRQQLCEELLKIMKEIKRTQDELREGENYDFQVDGVDYSINLEYLAKHIIVERNENIPFTDIEFPEDDIIDLEEKYKKYMIDLKRKGTHIIQLHKGPEYSFVFPDYLETVKFIKHNISKQLTDLEETEEATEELIDFPQQLFEPPSFRVSSVSVIAGNKFFLNNEYNKYAIYKPAEFSYDEVPILLNGEMKMNTQEIKERLLEELESFVRGTNVAVVLRRDPEITYREPSHLDFCCLFRMFYKELVDEIVEQGYDLPMFKFAHDPEISEEDQLYRTIILVNHCMETYDITNIQKIDNFTPNNPYLYEYYEYDEYYEVAKEATEAIAEFNGTEYNEFLYNRNAGEIDEGFYSREQTEE